MLQDYPYSIPPLNHAPSIVGALLLQGICAAKGQGAAEGWVHTRAGRVRSVQSRPQGVAALGFYMFTHVPCALVVCPMVCAPMITICFAVLLPFLEGAHTKPLFKACVSCIWVVPHGLLCTDDYNFGYAVLYAFLEGPHKALVQSVGLVHLVVSRGQCADNYWLCLLCYAIGFPGRSTQSPQGRTGRRAGGSKGSQAQECQGR